MITCLFSTRARVLAACIALFCASTVQALEPAWTYAVPKGFVDCGPAVGDLTGDGRPEIVVAVTSGDVIALDRERHTVWDQPLPGPFYTIPTICDVMGDLTPEVLVLGPFGTLYCLDGKTGYPIWESKRLGKVEWNTTAIAVKDLDRDGSPDIIVGDSLGTVMCLSGDGVERWSYAGAHGITACPAVGDLDGDGWDEVLIAGSKIPLVCLSHDGKELWRLPQAGKGASPVIADLNGDGKPEILAATDKTIVATNATGGVLWTYPMVREMDSSFSVADADGDGPPEIYAIDLSGHMVSLAPAGTLRWSVELAQRVRRSPVIADVDGDGKMEILAAGYSQILYVLDAEGHFKESLPLNGACNAGPTVADLSGDGRLSVLCPTTAHVMYAFEWPAGSVKGKTLWPEYRGGALRCASAMPSPAPNARFEALEFGNAAPKKNLFSVRVANPEGRPLTIALSVAQGKKHPSVKKWASSEASTKAALSYAIADPSEADLTFTATVNAGGKRLLSRTYTAHAAPVAKALEAVDSQLNALQDAPSRLKEPRALAQQILVMQDRSARLRERDAGARHLTPSDYAVLRHDATALEKECVPFCVLAQAVAKTPAFSEQELVLSGANPWAPFGGFDEIIENRVHAPSVTLAAFQKETESAALNIYNVGAQARTLRVELDPFISEAGVTAPARQVVTLHEVVVVPTETFDYSADALPRMNQGAILVVPSWDARQVWLNVNTAGLAPGVWKSRVRMRSLDINPLEVSCDISVTVWPAVLPKVQPLRLCHWGYVDQPAVRDYPEATLVDQVEHGTNVFVALSFPQAHFDKEGRLVGPIDFTAHDAYMKQYAPHGIVLFCGYQGALQGPGDHQSEAYRKASIAWLRAWVKHLAQLGVDHSGFALYPVDEPGLEPGRFEDYLRYAKIAREADPKIQMYTDPVGSITADELKAMTPYVDIWCPNRNGFLFKEHQDLLAIMLATGKPVWTYECLNQAKRQSPLGYYRGQSWLVWTHGLTGIGFWSYCSTPNDPWFLPTSYGEYIVIYKGDGVVTSKRWEAIRDGIEDFSMLTTLQHAAEDAEKRGVAPEAVRDAKRLLGEDASQIAAYCGVEEDGALPSLKAMSTVRMTEDHRWEKIQAVRQEMARLLAALRKS